MSDLIDDIIAREGGAKATNNPKDKGGRTQYGIAEHANPKAWQDGKVTYEEARAIYDAKYVRGPGFDKVTDEKLQAQLVDFGVTSGPSIAIAKVQGILKVDQDGILGPKTLSAINSSDPVILSNKLALERVKMIGRIVAKNPSQATFLNGWLNRALEFMRF